MANAIVSRRISLPNSLPLFDQEIWKPTPGWLGYEVSSLGRVRSWWANSYKKGVSGSGSVIADSPTLMKCSVRGGYVRAHVRNEIGNRKQVHVHELVLEAFVGPRPKGAVACHYPDPCKSNNRLDNLRWDTRAENAHDATRHNLTRSQKVTVEILKAMWPMLVDAVPLPRIAKQFNLSVSTVCDIKNYKHWAHITKTLPGVPPGVDPDGVQVHAPAQAPSVILESKQELWKPVVGWENYRISSHGRLLSRWPRGKRGLLPWEKARILEPNTGGRGYKVACLTNPCGKKQCIHIHVLVLTAFVGPRPPKLVACHSDGDKLNNHVANLRWDTQSENMIDNSRNNANSGTPFTIEDIRTIRAAIIAGEDREVIAARWGVSIHTIDAIRRRRSWKHVI